MNMDRYDNIEYDFDNTTAFIAADAVNQAEVNTDGESTAGTQRQGEQSTTSHEKKHSQHEIVIIFQLVVCILIAAAAFVIKSMGGELYESLYSLYNDNINNSIIFKESTESGDEAARGIIDDIITSQS